VRVEGRQVVRKRGRGEVDEDRTMAEQVVKHFVEGLRGELVRELMEEVGM
jgi:hypothetical protein